LEKDIFLELEYAVLNYDSTLVKELAQKAVNQGLNPLDCMSALTRAIRDVGLRYGKGELFLPDLIAASNAMQSAMPFLSEEIKKSGKKKFKLGTVVIGTVFGDIHSMGKTMVKTLLLAEGFEVIDLGVNVRTENFIDSVTKYKPDILAMSALLSTTILQQKNVVNKLIEENLRQKLKVIVGGAPVTQEYSASIGADGYDPTAPGAVVLAKKLLSINT
jgi:corrinoid protein of di/trimethylamine methyltransferase